MAEATALAPCKHASVGRVHGQSYCKSCGQSLFSFSHEDTRYFEDGATVAADRKQVKSIRKELEALALPEEVRDRADRIYGYRVGFNTYRSTVRKEVMFVCINDAYKELGIFRNPQEIADLLGLKRKGMSRGVMRCSSLYTGKPETNEHRSLTAVDLVPNMLTDCGIHVDPSHLEDIANIYQHAKERSELLNRSKPQSIAAALIYYYLSQVSGDKRMTKSEIAKGCGVSVMTLGKNVTELQRLCACE